MRPTGGARYPADLGFSKFTATCFRLCGWLYPALCVNSRSKLLYQIRTLLGYYVHDWLSNWTFMFVVLSGEYVGNTNIAQTQIISRITLRTYCPCECELSTQMCVHKDSHIHLCFYFAWSTQTPKCKACTQLQTETQYQRVAASHGVAICLCLVVRAWPNEHWKLHSCLKTKGLMLSAAIILIRPMGPFSLKGDMASLQYLFQQPQKTSENHLY